MYLFLSNIIAQAGLKRASDEVELSPKNRRISGQGSNQKGRIPSQDIVFLDPEYDSDGDERTFRCVLFYVIKSNLDLNQNVLSQGESYKFLPQFLCQFKDRAWVVAVSCA